MASKISAAALQYSKWLSRFICWVWAIYRFAVLFIAAIQPSVAESLANTIPGIDTIMLVNEGTYLANSLGEKILYSDKFVLKWLDKGGFKHLIGTLASKVIEKKEIEEEAEESEEDIQVEPIEEEIEGGEDDGDNNG